MSRGAVIPVIAIDGPSASGKGTVAKQVARALGWRYLDSGALYRLVALAAIESSAGWEDTARLAEIAGRLDVRFEGEEIWLAGRRATDAIRTEACSIGASRCAAVPAVRNALLDRQRRFREAPGLVAEGRDMGSVVFPDAALKVFLTASAEARAERRHKQLIDKGIPANIQTLLRDLQERDARDAERPVAPLKQLPDARLLDTTRLTVDEAVAQVLGWYRERAGAA
jgi:cytidylate kinase